MANIQLTTIRFHSGEYLPILVNIISWLPYKLALRWVMNQGRGHLASSSLENYLRSLKLIYEWADLQRIDFDTFIINGYHLDHNQFRSLIMFLRENSVSKETNAISNNTYNRHLYVVENFFRWILYPYNCGGLRRLSDKEITIILQKYKFFFDSQKLTTSRSRRMQPISFEEEASIRAYLKPTEDERGKILWPDNGLRKSSKLRNYLMFELAICLGLRRGELLKLRIDSLPRGNEKKEIKILRFPDDPADSRKNEPSVKSSERRLPIPPHLLKWISRYLNEKPPLGRRGYATPYLFVTRSGEPVSITEANNIVQSIGTNSGVDNLTWHRFRHTWAERLADKLLGVEKGLDYLRRLGGWKSSESAERYIGYATEKVAQQILEDYHKELYGDQ
jgi:integrase